MASGAHDAIVVGSGPNGLAAAIFLAQAGLRVLVIEAMETPGGAARSAELTLPGFIHDSGSAVHPMAAGSPFFRSLGLERFGLDWIHPDIPLAHPLPGQDHPAALLLRSLASTAGCLGRDAAAYRRLMAPIVRHWESIATEILQPIPHLPRHPISLAQFGMRALLPAQSLIRHGFRDEPARALFSGLAAHSFLSLAAPGSAAIGLVLGMMGHAVGWPFPRGGAQSIISALDACLRQAGGEVECGAPVRSLADLPPARALLLDISPWQFLRLAGDRLPARYRRALERFRHAPGIFKIDYALDAPVPWLNDACRRAGTIHLGGSAREIAASEQAVASSRIPDRPFVLAAQHSVFDSTRAPAGKHTFWAYCHIPCGSIFDMTSRIETQIERFAPGFRDRILARHAMGPAQLEAWNPNLAGGDISGGASTLWQLLARPVLSATPYRTPLPGVYLCSASTPPGGGVHGMCGFNAARAAIADVFA
jgi:phytoene dehydrogenase-like protein